MVSMILVCRLGIYSFSWFMKMELSVTGVCEDDSGLRGYLRGRSIYLYSFIISSIIVCRRSIFRFNHSFLSRRVEEVLRMGADFVFRRNIFDKLSTTSDLMTYFVLLQHVSVIRKC